MRGMTRLFLLAAFVLLGRGTKPSSVAASSLRNPFPLGTLGCLITDLCEEDEGCVNDKLFGHCRSRRHVSPGENYAILLTTSQLEQLETIVRELISKRYTWKDDFTQCVLQNTLVALDSATFFDPEDCQSVSSNLESSEWEKSVDQEISSILQNLMQYENGGTTRDFGVDLGRLRSNSNKRDEIVHVHKYFDQSKGTLKRDQSFPMSDDNEIYSYLTPLQLNSYDGSRSSLDAIGVDDPRDNKLTADDLQSYLRAIEQLEAYGDLARDVVDEEDLVNPASETADSDDSLLEQRQPDQDDVTAALLKETENLLENSAGTNNEVGPQPGILDGDSEEGPRQQDEQASEPETDKSTNFISISPPDEKVLEDLLEGNVDPHSLNQDQLQRLIRYVDAMVKTFDEQKQPMEESLLVRESEPDDRDGDVLNPSIDSDDNEDVAKGLAALAEEVKSVDNGQDADGLLVNKKAVDTTTTASPLEKPKKEDVVDMHYAYIEVKESVDQKQAESFMQEVSDVLELPPGTIGDIHVKEGKKITFGIAPNTKTNASKLDEDVEQPDVIDKLLKATGLTVLKAGIGKETQVEVKKDDSRYVVLTFVLVGCIAGILLAVVVIYLVRRHAQSKEKLAQLAATGDGNEASKDYQDLCRQRMQSKSSEKPEPLHAASRIGSVSESQVRSPSSRSSTSSWSEEPVASNMDISTGHIVLSYMEDHLKNQDRLDQEWEALCAYEADPNVAKVAMDASNARKNRYSDVLPYDHSRVALSSSTNVSGSDYINASFITDHDPRNPAYIATQGPLPHTVADFWQMVWEQGSVVIVMLSKLTENGTALCHRYWPEEGSDLYHIYEVHLVSEHIWCDDYLVRSFYLKNLQTNETRTVTQFHFLTWPQLGVPSSIKALLDFRRKVNKSYRGRSCPIVVHCSDGCGRAGTYILVDMVLNRMAKGAKEIDMAATLEHIRDQRMSVVKTKEQFQFSLAAVAEEVHAILKALPQ